MIIMNISINLKFISDQGINNLIIDERQNKYEIYHQIFIGICNENFIRIFIKYIGYKVNTNNSTYTFNIKEVSI